MSYRSSARTSSASSSSTNNSRERFNNKPVNVFYVWYTELCRRLNSNPVPVVKPARPKCQTVLDFVADRLKVDEWSPVINALRHDTSLHVINIRSRLNCPFLHDVDTEEKAKHMKRKTGTIWTAFILKSLLKSLSNSLRNTQVLTCLELDGLPMFSQYLEVLLQALKKNKTIKSLSLTHCSIKDVGCQMLCSYLRFIPNVEVLNLSDCSLTSESGAHLAKLIKFQQINRYCESWHNSLRYEDPETNCMRGIKRITLNCNPFLGDDGLGFILNELEDDLWIKALDLQKCGITETLSARILTIIQYSKSLEVFDLRQNELEVGTLEKVLQAFQAKDNFDPQYQWCASAQSVTWNSVQESSSKLSHFSMVSTHHNLVKTKSAPINKSVPIRILRKTVTTNNVAANATTPTSIISRGAKSDANEQKMQQLNTQLQEEIKKRKLIERQNKELQHKLQEINNDSKSIINNCKNNNGIKSIITTISKKINEDQQQQQQTCNSHKANAAAILANGPWKKVDKEKNGGGVSAAIMNNACKIFEKLLIKNKPLVATDSNANDKKLLEYYQGKEESIVEVKVSKSDDNGMTASQLSLHKFMEELKGSDSSALLNHQSN